MPAVDKGLVASVFLLLVACGTTDGGVTRSAGLDAGKPDGSRPAADGSRPAAGGSRAIEAGLGGARGTTDGSASSGSRDADVGDTGSGGTGGLQAPEAGADASMTLVDAALDARDASSLGSDGSDGATPIDAGDSCKAGHYSGALSGVYGSPYIMGVPIPLSAAIDFDLAPSTDGKTLEMVNGTISGNIDGALGTISTTLKGALDCRTRKLINGTLQGSYLVAEPPVPINGYLDANYDAQTYAFTKGTWSAAETPYKRMDSIPATGSGEGTWAANRKP
jgi:hypothetical protein